jgi:hypothetical protein
MTNPGIDAQLRQMVEHKIFTVSFIKRTTGEQRVMNCSLNYKNLTVGGELRYSPAEKQLLVVRDHQKDAIRSIAVDAISWIKFAHRIFVVERGLITEVTAQDKIKELDAKFPGLIK